MKKAVIRILGLLALFGLLADVLPCDSHGHDHGCSPECACTVHSPVDLAPVDRPCLSAPRADRLFARPTIPHDFSFSYRIFRPPIA